MAELKSSIEEQGSKLDGLASAAGEEDQVFGFMNPVKKRGRPAGSKSKSAPKPEAASSPLEPAQSPEAMTDAWKPIMKPAWGMVSSIGVKMAEDERASIGPTEMGVLVDTSSACMVQYLPGAFTTHANLAVLIMTLGNWSFQVYMIRQEKLAHYREMARLEKEAHIAGMQKERAEIINPLQVQMN